MCRGGCCCWCMTATISLPMSLQPWDAGRGGGPADGVICQALKWPCPANTTRSRTLMEGYFLGNHEPLVCFLSLLSVQARSTEAK